MNEGKSLFDGLLLPEGIDKDVLTTNILLQGGEFECIYANPYFMQSMIGMWSKKWLYTFQKWVDVLNMEYNPLENYDRIEDWTDQLNKGLHKNGRVDSGNTRTFNNQDQRTLNTQDQRTLNITQTETTEVSAFDSSTYQPSQKVTTANTGTDTMNNTGTDTMNYTGTVKDEFGQGHTDEEKENSKNTHDGRIHGNIGVTTSQQMLQAELDVARFNLIEQITDLFLSEFCIMVYD